LARKSHTYCLLFEKKCTTEANERFLSVGAHIIRIMTKRTQHFRPTLASIFSGGGGLDLGLEAAGFETLFTTDSDFHSCQTLKINQKSAKLLGKPFLQSAQIEEVDILKLTGSQILKKIGLKKGELDLLAGGPPCQAFSVFGKRLGREDSRGQLLYHYLRLLKEIQPKSFILENVYGMMTVEGGDIFKELLKSLAKPTRNVRYQISVHRINAMNYGVPQHRDRVFIIGSIDGHEVPEIPAICSDEKNSRLLRIRTVKDAFRGLPRMATGSISNHTGRKHSQRIIERYSSMTFGERDSHTRINKLDPNRPSYTIIVGSDKGGGKGHIHPYEPREVTPRESARVQCFPDWWEFSGTTRHPIRQIGNAVPSLLGFAVGVAVMEHIFNQDPVDFETAVDLLDQRHLFTESESIGVQARSKAS